MLQFGYRHTSFQFSLKTFKHNGMWIDDMQKKRKNSPSDTYTCILDKQSGVSGLKLRIASFVLELHELCGF